MGIVIKQSIRSSIIAYVGVVIGYINLLWIFPSYFDASQIGLIKLIQSSAMLLATFSQIGSPQIILRFFPEMHQKKGFMTLVFLFSLIGFLTVAILVNLFEGPISAYFSENSNEFVAYLGVCLVIAFLNTLFNLLESYSRSLLKIVPPIFCRDVMQRLVVTVLVLSFALDAISFDQMIRFLPLAYLLPVSLLGFYLFRSGGLTFNLSIKPLLGSTFKKMALFGLFSLIGAGGTQIVLQIDSIMVGGEIGQDATGIYTIAFFIGVVIEMPKRSIVHIAAPLVSQAFKKKDLKEVLKLYQQTSINQYIIGSLLLIGIWSNLDSIYYFIPNGEIYTTGMNVVLFIGLGKLSDMIFGVNGEIIVMSKYYRFNVIAIALLAILTICLNLVLIPLYGLTGAAIASFLAMLLFNVTKMLFVWKKFKMQPFTISTLGFSAIIGLTLLVNYLIPAMENLWVDVLVRSTVISMVLLIPTYLLNISKEMNGLINTILKKGSA